LAESFHRQRRCGVEMLIAVDSTRRGPALGGCRWRAYPDLEAARSDALALSRAMTLKAALARLQLGGGKAVVVGDPRERTREQMLAFGEFVESLAGRYVTAADMGTGEREMAVFAERTRHVVGLPRSIGGCGDPGPWTALGVRMALEAVLAEAGGSLRGVRVAVQGAGSVGGELVRLLVVAGAQVEVADPMPAALEALPEGVSIVEPEGILETGAEVFAPCGPPAVIDAARAARLCARVVCGAANNPLADLEAARVLRDRGVLCVPDFLANAGGLISLAVAMEGGGAERVQRQLQIIPENLRRVFERSKASGETPLESATEMALELAQGVAH